MPTHGIFVAVLLSARILAMAALRLEAPSVLAFGWPASAVGAPEGFGGFVASDVSPSMA